MNRVLIGGDAPAHPRLGDAAGVQCEVDVGADVYGPVTVMQS